ncbi:hypothetical protein DEO72_LG8g229 [Vigna unguiculata]|uniref:Uncharacterized protein n=1 Tax=Vigna unguiculata TaxID=3917 RepID=A0A4D6KSB7_VIGUN|nr:hypothetical protein DEO72_LG1g355 [Vigna unguiculata]QCE02218.1 hypothetical protein DEO72_LG8g229 [Vigna unguiculata]
MRSQLITNLPARDLIRTHPGPTKNLVLEAQRLAQQSAATENKTPTLPRQLSSGTTSLTAWRHTRRCQAPGYKYQIRNNLTSPGGNKQPVRRHTSTQQYKHRISPGETNH